MYVRVSVTISTGREVDIMGDRNVLSAVVVGVEEVEEEEEMAFVDNEVGGWDEIEGVSNTVLVVEKEVSVDSVYAEVKT